MKTIILSLLLIPMAACRSVNFSPSLAVNLSLYSRGSNQSPAASSQEGVEHLTELLTEGGGAASAAIDAKVTE